MTSRLPPWLDPRTAYVHVPFCGHHCGYCDFAVTAGNDHLIELYLDALAMELATLGEPRPVESLFIGGGTPTYLSADALRRLLTTIREWLPIVPGSAAEFSIESTPDSLDAEKIAVMAEFGVNRLSIGVQSFHTHVLQSLERQHSVERIARAVEIVRPQIPALSFDLIFGAPGQTIPEWEADLHTALAFAPDHLSTYGLTYEKGTPLWKQRERGQVREVGEDLELQMYQAAIANLRGAGFEHYEVSNFAKLGQRCRHNERYWANDAYYGFGVGAARYVNGSRDLNIRDTKMYIRKVLAGESPTFQTETLDDRERAFETLAIQLRRIQGIVRDDFQLRTGYDIDALIGEPLQHFADEGLLQLSATDIRLTPRGTYVADGIVTSLMKSA